MNCGINLGTPAAKWCRIWSIRGPTLVGVQPPKNPPPPIRPLQKTDPPLNPLPPSQIPCSSFGAAVAPAAAAAPAGQRPAGGVRCLPRLLHRGCGLRGERRRRQRAVRLPRRRVFLFLFFGFFGGGRMAPGPPIPTRCLVGSPPSP